MTTGSTPLATVNTDKMVYLIEWVLEIRKGLTGSPTLPVTIYLNDRRFLPMSLWRVIELDNEIRRVARIKYVLVPGLFLHEADDIYDGVVDRSEKSEQGPADGYLSDVSKQLFVSQGQCDIREADSCAVWSVGGNGRDLD
ncbi:hypothetical protein AAE478_010152 [Parahypoxylon ruwenzoriense]